MKLKGILLILLAASLPLSVFATDLSIFLIAFHWIIDGKFSQKWNTIKSSNWLKSLLVLFFIYGLGLLWGSNHSGAVWVFQKSAILLVLPILYSFDYTDKQIKHSVFAFLLSMMFSAIVALLINIGWLQHLFKYSDLFAKNWNNSAFMPYTYHNVFLAFSVLISSISLLYQRHSKSTKLIFILIIIVSTLSLFTERGRAGQLAFLIIMTTFFFVNLWKRKGWLLTAVISLLVIFLLSYNYSTPFKNRIDFTINSLNKLEKTDSNSTNTRYFFTTYSLDMISQKPILGYGTGSFVDEFSAMSPHAKKIVDGIHKTPHNNFLFIWFELGLLGLITFLAIFFFQIKEYLNQPLGKYRFIFPLAFLSIMLFDAYFQNHNSAVLYAYLSMVFHSYSFK